MSWGKLGSGVRLALGRDWLWGEIGFGERLASGRGYLLGRNWLWGEIIFWGKITTIFAFFKIVVVILLCFYLLKKFNLLKLPRDELKLKISW